MSGDLNFNVYKDNQMNRYIIATTIAGVNKADIDVRAIGKSIYFTIKRDVKKILFPNGTEGFTKEYGKLQLDGVFKGEVRLPFEVSKENIVRTIYSDGVLFCEVTDSVTIE